MRSTGHTWHSIASVVFYVLCALGIASVALYSKLTPNMYVTLLNSDLSWLLNDVAWIRYEGAKHSIQGYLVLLAAAGLSALDMLAALRRAFAYMRSGDHFTFREFCTIVILGREKAQDRVSEYEGLIANESGYDEIELGSPKQSIMSRSGQGESPQDAPELNPRNSDDTLHDFMHDLQQPTFRKKGNIRKRIASTTFAIVERSLVFAGFIQVLTGIVTYTGGCRQNYLNGCLAHLISKVPFSD